MAKNKKGKKKGTGDNFDSSKHKSSGFDAIPAGLYPAQLIKSEPRDSKNGRYVNCQFQIIDGKFKGRMIFNNLNLKNTSEQAVEIAEGQLGDFIRAAFNGEGNLKHKWDFTPLLNKPVEIRVRVDKGNEQYTDSNSIMGYRPLAKKKKGKKNEPAWD